MSISVTPRVAERRQRTIDTALDHATDVMTESGVGGLTISEVARRMGMRPPSLYKYFPSLHALYDALFARATREQLATIESATSGLDGVAALRAGSAALMRLAVEHSALAQLVSWRPVPEFEPAPETFALSVDIVAKFRALVRDAVRGGELTRAADRDDAIALLSIVLTGIVTQQLANEPGVAYDEGRFTRLTDRALDMYLAVYTPRRSDATAARSRRG
jgi:AcrR family transcriptional regulator